MVMAVLPSRFEEQAGMLLDSIQKLLVRYFVGLLLEVLGVMALNTIGLTIVGFGFSNAVVIGLVTGVFECDTVYRAYDRGIFRIGCGESC